ncbi:MAG: hypothetical protein ACOX7R_00430 [Acetivibrionales bacterium]
MKWKKDWEIARQRLAAFWEREVIDRCCVSVIVTEKQYKEQPIGKTQEERRRWYMDPALIYERHYNRFEHTYFGGEGFPMYLAKPWNRRTC